MSSVEYLGRGKTVNNISPLVSVCIATYQHAGYIAECLDGVLSQDASFPIEILIGEDQSSDGTREACIAYADKFPDKIRLFLNDRTDVIYIDGRPSGRANILNLFAESRGKFIALCEGDDCWTDKSKLERQVAIFQEIPECSLVFHNALVVKNDIHDRKFSDGLVEGFYDIESVISKLWFVPTQSILFRKDLIEFGVWARHIFNFDYSIQLMLATKFPFYYVDRVMSIYRVHEGGISRGREILYHQIKHVETLSVFNCVTEFKYDQLIKKRLEFTRAKMLEIVRDDIRANILTSAYDDIREIIMTNVHDDIRANILTNAYDDIRAIVLTNARHEILHSTIMGMSYWEKALTFRYYSYVASYFMEKTKGRWNALLAFLKS